MNVAVVTGASQGFGAAMAGALARAGWALVVDARDGDALRRMFDALPVGTVGEPVAGDVTDPDHRAELAAAAQRLGGASLLVHNASELGPSPLPRLDDYPLDALRRVFEVDVIAPVALTQALLPQLRVARGTIVTISSDAAAEAYEGWGGYGAAKAALDQVAAVLGAEESGVRVLSFDPGDMRTAMHQRAYPGEDISDRPEPESVVPALLALLDGPATGGRHRAADIEAGPSR